MIVRFADREVDLDRIEVRGPGGVIDVQPQVFGLIEYLIHHRDRVISHDELMDELWGDRFVSASAITSRVKHARRVLGDDGERQHVIKTVQGRGYRFVADTDGHAAPSAPTPDERDSPPAEPVEDERWPFVGRAELLDDVAATLAETSAALLIDGDDRVGRSRFLRAAGERAAHDGHHVVWIQAGSPGLALSGLVHLLPADVFDVPTADDAIARALLFRRAVEAIEERADGRRTVLIVDDVDRVDPMSRLIVGHLLDRDDVVGVVSRRAGSEVPVDDVAGAAEVRRVVLGPLDEADVDVILYRYLGGAIDRTSLRRLWELSRGLPGVLRDIVSASYEAGALRCVEGVWRLTGTPTSSGSAVWPPSGTSDHVIAGAERLATIGSLPLAAAEQLIGATELDELDAAGLLALAERNGTAVVSMADELLASSVSDSMPPLRRHRARVELVEQLAVRDEPEVLATIVEWGPEFAERVDPLHRLLAAVGAMSSGDVRSAETLVDSLDSAVWPQASVIKAEIDVQHGRHARAEEVLDSIELGGLDDLSRSLALRRKASIGFAVHHRHDESLAWLRDRADESEGDLAGSLLARRIALLAYLGRYPDVLVAVGELAGIDGEVDLEAVAASDLGGNVRLEVMLACSSALGALGRFDEALGAADEALRLLPTLPPAWRTEPADHELMLRLGALVNLGRVRDAVRIIDEHVPAGRVTAFGILPSHAAEIQLTAGRPRAAREIMRPAISSASSQAYPQYVGLNAAMMARCVHGIDGDDAWREFADVAQQDAASSSGSLRRRIAFQLGEILPDVDPPSELVGMVRAALDDARSVGARLGEMDMSCVLVSIDSTPETAQRMVGRVEEIAGRFPGELWPIRVAHVRARADGTSLDAVEAEYRRLGYATWADRAAQGR